MASSRQPPTRKLVVGLTGGIGCGKSTLLRHFRNLGCACSDDDAIVHGLYEPGGEAVEPLRRMFPGAVDASGAVQRDELSRLIQSSEDPAGALRSVEAVVHPLVMRAKQAFVKTSRAWLVILDTPLLMEGFRSHGIQSGPGYLDAVVLATCAPDVQRQRCLARPGMTAEKLDFILQRQMKLEDRLAHADFVVDTAPAGMDETSSHAAARSQAAAAVATLAARHGGPWQLHAPTPLGTRLSNEDLGSSDAQLPITCVTFDLDDTLFPTKSSIVNAVGAFRNAMEVHAPRILQRAKESGESLGDAMQKAMQAARKEQPLLAHDFTEIRRVALMQLAKEAEEPDPRSVAQHCVEAFLKGRGSVEEHLYVDVLPALRALKQRGLRLGSITNGNAMLAEHAPNLRELLEFEVSASSAGAMKPAVAPFLEAAHAAGVSDIRQMAHVGDSLRDDVHGARALGLRAVLLRRPEGRSVGGPVPARVDGASAEPDATITSLEDLVELTLRWHSAAHVESRL